MHLPFDYSLVQLSKIEKQVRICEFLNRTLLLLLHFPDKIVQRLNMPQAFAGDGTEGQRREKVYKKNFRYVKELSFAEGFKFPTVAPIIYGGFGVAGQGDNILHGHDILIFAEQLGVIVVHLPENILGQFLGELCHIVGAVPALRCRIEFRENRPFLQICFHILFSDFIALGFLIQPLAGHLAAFEQVQRRGLADVANAEELLLVHHFGNTVPVNGEYIHL